MSLDQRQCATLYLVGAVDGEVELGLACEVGQRNAERFCLAMRLDGCGDADDTQTVANAASDLINHQPEVEPEPRPTAMPSSTWVAAHLRRAVLLPLPDLAVCLESCLHRHITVLA